MTVYVNNKGTDFKEVVDDQFLLSDDLQSLVELGLHFYPSIVMMRTIWSRS